MHTQAVEVIHSKIGYDTIIPVTYVTAEALKNGRYRQYDIIDVRNPFDVEDRLHPPQPEEPDVQPTVDLPEFEELHKARHAPGRTRRRGWAEQTLSLSTPYQMVRHSDLTEQPTYVLDEEDYHWCQRSEVSPDDLASLFTALEWRYVSYVLESSTPTRSADSRTAAQGSIVPTSGQKRRYHRSGGRGTLFSVNSTRRRKPLGGARPVGRPRATPAVKQEDDDRVEQQTGAKETSTEEEHFCAVCCKPVQSLLQVATTSGVAASVERGQITPKGFPCSTCGVWAHTHCWCLTRVPQKPQLWLCYTCFLLSEHKRKSTLRCVLCARSGGVMIPFVSSYRGGTPPPGFVSEKQSSPTSPCYVSVPDRRGKMGEPQATENPSHSPATSVAFLSGYIPAPLLHQQELIPPGTDGMCHVVCALAFQETTVCVPPTLWGRGGRVDRTKGPYAHPLPSTRRHQKHVVCLFCQHEMGMCVHCGYAKCFEPMHPSCAAEARSLECFSTVRYERQNKGVAEEDTGSPAPSFPPSSESCWRSCLTFCRQHFNFASSGTGSWRELAEAAERQVLDADPAELLRGAREQRRTRLLCEQQLWGPSDRKSDGGEEKPNATQVVKRRRGRPPSAAVQQREACRPESALIMAYWQEKRRLRRSESVERVSAINQHTSPLVSAALRPEIIKVSKNTVRLSHFLSLIPEWQLWLVNAVEHELPIPDEEYDDVQAYRKHNPQRQGRAAASRLEDSEGFPDAAQKLMRFQRMTAALQDLTSAMREQAKVQQELITTELKILERKCGWFL